MPQSQRRGGVIEVQWNGEVQDAMGDFTYNLGRPKREAIIGSDGPHGYKETPQVGFIEGEIIDRGTLDLAKLVTLEGATVVLKLANGKTIMAHEAYFSGDGSGETGEGKIKVRFEGRVEEV